jgi:hypothetical protein
MDYIFSMKSNTIIFRFSAPAIRGPGACGVLQLAEPFDACTQLTNKAVPREGVYASFALIIRGTCTFEKKVRNAQAAGFSAAIVYNNEDSSDLVSSKLHYFITNLVCCFMEFLDNMKNILL